MKNNTSKEISLKTRMFLASAAETFQLGFPSFLFFIISCGSFSLVYFLNRLKWPNWNIWMFATVHIINPSSQTQIIVNDFIYFLF